MTRPFQRWIGQTVYREVCPTFGPNSSKTLGIRRGTIIRISPYKHNETVHKVKWDADISWSTGEATIEPKIDGGYFDFGLLTIPEMQILLNGGLLGRDGPVYDEPQCDSLRKILPLYQQVVDNPTLPYICVGQLEEVSK